MIDIKSNTVFFKDQTNAASHLQCLESNNFFEVFEPLIEVKRE